MSSSRISGITSGMPVVPSEISQALIACRAPCFPSSDHLTSSAPLPSIAVRSGASATPWLCAPCRPDVRKKRRRRVLVEDESVRAGEDRDLCHASEDTRIGRSRLANPSPRPDLMAVLLPAGRDGAVPASAGRTSGRRVPSGSACTSSRRGSRTHVAWVVDAAENARPPLRGHCSRASLCTQRLEVGRGAVEDVEDGATELGHEVVDRDVHRLAPADRRRRFERRVSTGVVERRDEPVAVIGRERIAIQGRHGGEPTVRC